uniref:Acetoin reductase family protein n=1 Tax=Moniliophthora roreri TaxID=221103 RepID=A0A0W0FA28_MONRR
MVEGVVKGWGELNVMVENAEIAKYAHITEMTTDEFDKVFAVNVRGTFLCYKYAGKQMIKQGKGGRIVGAASVAGKMGALNASAYCGSNTEELRVVSTAAKEFGPYGTTVNVYAPGAIDTSMMDYLSEESEKYNDLSPGDWMKRLAQNLPLKRNGNTEDVAGLVSYLVSKKAGFITGQNVSINGGSFCD